MINTNTILRVSDIRDGAFGRIADIEEANGELPGRLVCSCLRVDDAKYICDAVNTMNRIWREEWGDGEVKS